MPGGIISIYHLPHDSNTYMIRIILCISIFLTAFFNRNYAQYLHTSVEIQRLIEKSDQTYVLDTLYQIPNTTAFPLLVEPGWYGFSTPEGITLEKPYGLTTKTQQKYHKKAKKYDSKGKYIESIDLYKKSLIKTPTNSEIMHQIATAYQSMQDTTTATYWYEKAVDTNPLDGIAYAKLGDIYRDADPKKALNFFITAHLLNRNDTAILKKLQSIYQDKNQAFLHFDFAPVYEVHHKFGVIYILANEAPWHAFASCKAIWQYEEKYREKMSQLSNDNSGVVQEKECLLNALLAYERMENGKEKFPELYCLGKALQSGLTDEFLLYEVYARVDPLLLLKLDGQDFERVKEYVIKCKVIEK